MNIVEVCHLDIASFGAWDDPAAESISAVQPERPAYRKLLLSGDRLTGAIILGPLERHLDDQRRRHAQGARAVQVSLGRFKAHLRANPFDIKPAYIASKTTGALLPVTVLGRPSKAPGDTPVAV